MSLDNKYPIMAFKQQGLVVIAGKFSCEAGGPARVVGRGFTVARSDVGKHTVTLSSTCREIVSLVVGVNITGDDLDHAAASGTLGTTGPSSFITYTKTAGTDADLGANATVSFVAVCADTSEYGLVTS